MNDRKRLDDLLKRAAEVLTDFDEARQQALNVVSTSIMLLCSVPVDDGPRQAEALAALEAGQIAAEANDPDLLPLDDHARAVTVSYRDEEKGPLLRKIEIVDGWLRPRAGYRNTYRHLTGIELSEPSGEKPYTPRPIWSYGR
jgi:hypothetical protein